MRKVLLILALVLLPLTAHAQQEEVDLGGLTEQQIVELKEKAAQMRGNNVVSNPVKQAEVDSTYVVTAVQTMAEQLGYETTGDFLRSDTGKSMWTLFWVYQAHEAGFNLLAALFLVLVGLPVWIWLFKYMCLISGKRVTEDSNGTKTTEYRYFSPGEVTDSRGVMYVTGLIGVAVVITLIITA
jgi:hypothetical protein